MSDVFEGCTFTPLKYCRRCGAAKPNYSNFVDALPAPMDTSMDELTPQGILPMGQEYPPVDNSPIINQSNQSVNKPVDNSGGMVTDWINAPKITYNNAKSTFGVPVDNSIPNSHHNPLDIRWDKNTSPSWAADVDGSEGQKGFEAFKTDEAGIMAGRRALISPLYRGKTISQALKMWSNKGYNGSDSGLNTGQKIQDLSKSNLNKLMIYMATKEGYKQIDKMTAFLANAK